jgi:hypothetical protein
MSSAIAREITATGHADPGCFSLLSDVARIANGLSFSAGEFSIIISKLQVN